MPRRTLSVRSWRSSRPWPAPRAVRTANSASRAATRARSRFATLTQAMSRTRPTAPRSTSRGRRTSPTVACWRETAVPPSPSSASGYCFARRSAIVATSCRARSTETPGLRRPMTRRYQAPRLFVRNTSSYSRGAHASVPWGYAKLGGATPTTRYGSRFSCTVCPTAPGSAPNLCAQSRWLSTTTLACPGSFSPSANPRPWTGLTPSRSKKLELTRAAWSRTGSPRPVIVRSSLSMAARDAKEGAWATTSRKFCGEYTPVDRPSHTWASWTRRSGSSKGSGLSRTASMTLKIALLAPMPRASVATATREKPGACHRRRRA